MSPEIHREPIKVCVLHLYNVTYFILKRSGGAELCVEAAGARARSPRTDGGSQAATTNIVRVHRTYEHPCDITGEAN